MYLQLRHLKNIFQTIIFSEYSFHFDTYFTAVRRSVVTFCSVCSFSVIQKHENLSYPTHMAVHHIWRLVPNSDIPTSLIRCGHLAIFFAFLEQK